MISLPIRNECYYNGNQKLYIEEEQTMKLPKDKRR